MKLKKKIRMNLQLFSDGIYSPEGPTPGDNPLTSEPTPETPVDNPVDPGDNQVNPGDNQVDPGTPASNEPQQDPEFDVKTYMDSMMSQIMDRLPQDKQPEVPKVEEKPKELTPEEVEKINEDFMNKFYDNPTNTIQELAQSIAMEQIKPIKEHYENQQKSMDMQNQIQDFQAKTPDLQEYAGDMATIIENNPHINNMPNALEVAYKMAKGERAAQLKPQTFEQMLADPGNLEKLIQNESIKKMILNNHMNDIKSNQPPVGVGANSGGQTNITPANEPKSIGDATKAWLSTLG